VLLFISESSNGSGMQGIRSLNGPHATALKYRLVVMFMKPECHDVCHDLLSCWKKPLQDTLCDHKKMQVII